MKSHIGSNTSEIRNHPNTRDRSELFVQSRSVSIASTRFRRIALQALICTMVSSTVTRYAIVELMPGQ